MRVMVIMKANAKSEAGEMPSERLLTEMTAYNEDLAKSGMLLAGEGLHPSSKGARVLFEGTGTSVVHGPFAETRDLIAGFWLLQVKSMDEAIDWIRRVPNPDGDHHEIEIRQVFEAADFGEDYTPELREREDALREQTGHYGEAPQP